MTRQIRVSVNGKFQFTVPVRQDESAGAVAARIADVLGFTTYTVGIAVGQIDFHPNSPLPI